MVRVDHVPLSSHDEEPEPFVTPWTTEMKLIIATMYSNFATHVVDDEGIE